MGLLEISNKEYHDDGFFHGSYQFTRLEDIINQFMVVYVGEDKIIPKAKKLTLLFTLKEQCKNYLLILLNL